MHSVVICLVMYTPRAKLHSRRNFVAHDVVSIPSDVNMRRRTLGIVSHYCIVIHSCIPVIFFSTSYFNDKAAILVAMVIGESPVIQCNSRWSLLLQQLGTIVSEQGCVLWEGESLLLMTTRNQYQLKAVVCNLVGEGGVPCCYGKWGLLVGPAVIQSLFWEEGVVYQIKVKMASIRHGYPAVHPLVQTHRYDLFKSTLRSPAP